MESSPQPPVGYDFKRAFLVGSAREQLIAQYLEDEEQFGVISVKVMEGNQYISDGARPTGIRDLEFSYEVKIFDKKGTTSITLRRKDLDDVFSIAEIK